MAALHTARLGLRTLLIEKSTWPRAKPCGCCVNAAAVDLLTDAAVYPVDHPNLDPAHALNHIQLHAYNRSITHKLPGSYPIERSVLDADIVGRAVRFGAEFMPETTASLPFDLHHPYQPIQLHGSSTQNLSAAVVISAHGLSHPASEHPAFRPITNKNSRMGVWGVAPPDAARIDRNEVYMAASSHGYVGAIVLPDGRVNIAAAIQPGFIRECAGPAHAIVKLCDEAGAPLPVADPLAIHYRGTPLLTRNPHNVAAGRVLAVGDAAGYVEPFTGEGIAWALASGRDAAHLAAKTLNNQLPIEQLATDWIAHHRRSIRRRQRNTRLIASLIRNSSATRAAIALLAAAPPVTIHLTKSAARPYHHID